MSLRGLLHSIMYKDRVTVYRAQKITADDGSDDYNDEFLPVYEELPCKLSQYGKALSAHVESRAMVESIDLRICCDPEIEIHENDILKVSHQGQVFTLYAGKRFAYPTHQEISVRRNKEAEDGD